MIFIFNNSLILLHNLKINPSIYILLLKNFIVKFLIIFLMILFFNWINLHQFLKISLFNLICKCILLIFLIFTNNAWVHQSLIFRLVITIFIIEFCLFISFYFIVVSVNVMFFFFFAFKLPFKIFLFILFILFIYAPKYISELFL
jgi:hypothetical protein